MNGNEFLPVTVIEKLSDDGKRWLADRLGDRELFDDEHVLVDVRWPDGTVTPETMLCSVREEVDAIGGPVWVSDIYIVKEIHGAVADVSLRQKDIFVRIVPA